MYTLAHVAPHNAVTCNDRRSRPIPNLGAVIVCFAPTSGAFVSDIADAVKIKAVGAARIDIIIGAAKPALFGIFGLWPWCVLLVPAELSPPAELRPPS